MCNDCVSSVSVLFSTASTASPFDTLARRPGALKAYSLINICVTVRTSALSNSQRSRAVTFSGAPSPMVSETPNPHSPKNSRCEDSRGKETSYRSLPNVYAVRKWPKTPPASFLVGVDDFVNCRASSSSGLEANRPPPDDDVRRGMEGGAASRVSFISGVIRETKIIPPPISTKAKIRIKPTEPNKLVIVDGADGAFSTAGEDVSVEPGVTLGEEPTATFNARASAFNRSASIVRLLVLRSRMRLLRMRASSALERLWRRAFAKFASQLSEYASAAAATSSALGLNSTVLQPTAKPKTKPTIKKISTMSLF